MKFLRIGRRKNKPSHRLIYFESPDGTKGVYVSSWQFADDARTVEQIAASFQAVERRRFAAMDKHNWVITETNATEAGIYVSTLDALSEATPYRITTRFLGSLTWVVRASFHDYYFADREASTLYLSPLISLLQLH